MKRIMIAAASVALLSGSTAMAALVNGIGSVDLTDGVAVAADMHESNGPDGSWSSSATPVFTTAGSTVNYMTTDNDLARGYLATDFTDYASMSWKAHITVETPTAEKNYIFFGLGSGIANSYNNWYEPTSGDRALVRWSSGNSSAGPRLYINSTVADTDSWLGDPGYDIWMTYDHVAQTVTYEIDAWNNGGVLNGIDRTLTASTSNLNLNASNASIFFGGNATATYSNFTVEAIPEPATLGLIGIVGGGMLFVRRKFMM